MTDFDIIRRSMKARLFSTVTTILTVAVAVGLMLVLLSMRDSGRRAFQRGSGNMHILVSADSSPLTSILNCIFYANAPQRPLTMTKFESLFPREDPAHFGPDAKFADGRIAYAIPVQQGDSFRGFPTMATVPEFFTLFQPVSGVPFKFREGKPFASDTEIVLGAEIARATGFGVGKQLFVTHGYRSDRGHRAAAGDVPGGDHAAEHDHDHENAEAKPGEEDIHRDSVFTVVGVMEPTGSPHDRAVFVPLNASWLLHAQDKRERENKDTPKLTAADLRETEKLITGVYVATVTRAGSDVSAATGPVFAMFRADHSLTVAIPGQEIEKLFLIVGNVDRILLAMAAVVMVSSGIAIMLALYNSMEQRRRQIAVLRVLGCSQPRVFGLVVTESALLGLIGAVAGFTLCLVGVRLVVAAMKDRLGMVIEPVFGAEWVLAVLTGTVALAALAGVIPAVMAYRTSVAKNLKPLA